MRKNYQLLEKRRRFVQEYVCENHHKQMKSVVTELSERLFVTERTIYRILNEEPYIEKV